MSHPPVQGWPTGAVCTAGAAPPSTHVRLTSSAKLAAQLELRPCEHQVAGHLFEGEACDKTCLWRAGTPLMRWHATGCRFCLPASERRGAPKEAVPLQAARHHAAPPSLLLTLPPAHTPIGIADGKAGSLVDDRGHFYKPLQRGPRGDRERAFYDAVAATLRAEEAAAAAAVAAAQERQAAERRTGRRASSPIAMRNGSATGVVASEWAAAAELASSAASSTGDSGGLGMAGEAPPSPHVPLPWRRRQLLQTFPSYKEYRRERGPMHIMQVRPRVGACYSVCGLSLCQLLCCALQLSLWGMLEKE